MDRSQGQINDSRASIIVSLVRYDRQPRCDNCRKFTVLPANRDRKTTPYAWRVELVVKKKKGEERGTRSITSVYDGRIKFPLSGWHASMNEGGYVCRRSVAASQPAERERAITQAAEFTSKREAVSLRHFRQSPDKEQRR